MAIVQCSLQCSDNVVVPGQVSCGISNVFVNQEIRVAFNNPIDRNSLSNNTFQLIEVPGGRTPAGSFTIDAVDPRILIYRPEVTFDSAGSPIFGFTEDAMYAFHIPAFGHDSPGPYIRDTQGSPNRTSLQCTLFATEGIRDATPGRPRASVFVRRVLGYDPDGDPIVDPDETPAIGAVDVWRNTVVRIVFDDVMNPATLANPVTGLSSFIRGFVDADGNTNDPSDQVALAGTFTVTIDQRLPASTTVIFTPSTGLPSAGRDIAQPRKVVIQLSPQIADLGGNTLFNPGSVAFTPERILFDPLVVGETFDEPSREDSARTASAWGSGFLATGPGGGSGRLGDLIVLPQTVVELNTDIEDFSGITNPQIFDLTDVIPRDVPPDPVPFAVVGGVFEFTRLRVDPGGVLRFRGSNPARIYVRGVCDIQGLIDVSGVTATLQSSKTAEGGAGGPPGPNGGAGGRGGHRPDGSAFVGNFQGNPLGGVPTLAGPADVLDPASYAEVNGFAGGGIAAPSTVDPSPTFVGGGGGALAWPQPMPGEHMLHMPANVTDLSGLEFDPVIFCQHHVPAAPGGGGAHALDGKNGIVNVAIFSPVTLPPEALGGDNSLLGIDELVRTLAPELGFLRGGGGGGGGGASVQFTAINGLPDPIDDCMTPLGPGLQISAYASHSAAGGGGGGGGLQVVAGRRLNLAGILDASGGDGGSGTFPPPSSDTLNLAQAGGGGAGGAVLLQSARIGIQAVPGRIDVSGGFGGQGSGDLRPPFEPSLGGRGSPGFIRLESPTPSSVAIEQAKVLPLASDLTSEYGNQVSIEDIFTTAVWQPAADAPSGWSGAQSCWIRPTGNFFRLVFADDNGQLGWDAHLRIAGQATPQSFRGPNDIAGVSLEELYGSEFGTAPIVIRFQGARATTVLVDACSVLESGPGSPIAPNSLSAWLRHPMELNTFFPDDGLSSNMFRFLILWDRSQPEFAGIEGLEDLTVTIQPD